MAEPTQPTIPGVHSYLKREAHPNPTVRCKPYFRLRSKDAVAAPDAAWNVPALCAAYNWPANLVGGGVIAIVEMGGGWLQTDMNQFFAGLGQPVPSITDVSVDSTKNTPTPGSTGDDPEVAMDIQVAGAAYFAATGSPATIRVYWSQDIAAAIKTATADGCDVCSISWGADEADWGTVNAEALDAAAAAACTAGMVVFAAAGDNDSSDGGPNAANVDCPSSCPHVVGCGGTTKTATAETVWNNDPGQTTGNGTGGGFSTIFKPLPDWQIGAPNGPGRMVPDVSANADTNTGYNVVVGGQGVALGGTSAVAPLYAGLFAAFGKKLGYLAPKLWLNPMCFNDITAGDNGQFRADRGPDPCSGLGSPIGGKLAAAFGAAVKTA